jgi:HlyD family secretion protein
VRARFPKNHRDPDGPPDGTERAPFVGTVRKRVLGVVLLGVAAAAGFLYYRQSQVTVPPALTTVPVGRGDVVETIDATGTLQAVTTVQVGTQVSGTIKALGADFNSQVRRGQVIAQLEPSLFQAQVEQARATVVRLEAEAGRAAVQLDDAQNKLGRARELSAKALISTSDLESAVVNARQAEAAVKAADAQIVQARASLSQAQVNLAHTIIRAPIDGIVISRNVDVGQTVAASMQAPTLFVIARDLTQMQVEASVAEADIGRIRTGQTVGFNVDAYPGDVFAGTVSQVRLQPTVEQNVVSYVTVIDVHNPELKLKPGMTANVTVEVARATAVLRVPNAALRVRPSAEVLAVYGGQSPAEGAGRPGGRQPVVWTIVDGSLVSVRVTPGISDGRYTAVSDTTLLEGTEVVTSIAVAAAAAPATPASSPLLPARGRGPGGARTGTPRPPGS